ncbi:Uncharacterized protein dnm_023350 [Desulfonema magnum]|uniref:Uncharacterized protein n=1 Tax=Desulfonema magnum TaxID=45655 RepID=A0A975BJ89_9BACT|nr:Uncharacterized protein dnm_023350 [Desulfonema magnum]
MELNQCPCRKNDGNYFFLDKPQSSSAINQMTVSSFRMCEKAEKIFHSEMVCHVLTDAAQSGDFSFS